MTAVLTWMSVGPYTDSTSHTAPVHASAVSGQLVVAVLVLKNDPGTAVAVTGYSVVQPHLAYDASSYGLSAHKKVIGAEAGATVTATHGSPAREGQLFLLGIDDYDATTQIVAVGTYTDFSISALAGANTTGTNDCLLIGIAATRGSVTAWGGAPTWVFYDGSTGGTNEDYSVWTKTVATGTNTGIDSSLTPDGLNRWSAITLAIAPEASSGEAHNGSAVFSGGVAITAGGVAIGTPGTTGLRGNALLDAEVTFTAVGRKNVATPPPPPPPPPPPGPPGDACLLGPGLYPNDALLPCEPAPPTPTPTPTLAPSGTATRLEILVTGPDRVPVAQLDDYATLDLVARFNAVGRWALAAHTSAVPPELLTPGSGLHVVRDGRTLIAGPVTSIDRSASERGDRLTVGGADNMVWLADRLATPGEASAFELFSLPQRDFETAIDPGPIGIDTVVGVNNWVGQFVDLERSTTFAHTGTTSLKFTATALPTSEPRSLVLGTGTLPDVAAGTEYRFSAWLRALTTARPWRLQIWWYEDEGTQLATSESPVVTAQTGGWTEVSVTAVAPPSANRAYPVLVLGPGGVLPDGESHFMDDTRFVRTDGMLGYYDFPSGYHVLSAQASTVLIDLVNRNAGPGTITARQVPGLVLATDPAVGSTVGVSVRFDPLLETLQSTALSGGDIGFRVVPSGTGLVFETFQPLDVSAAAEFSLALGNLAEFTYRVARPTQTHSVVAGQGEGAVRQFWAQESADRAVWGRIEGFSDRRDTDLIAELQDTAVEQLANGGQTVGLSITPIDTPRLRFGVDYTVGDKVTVEVDGERITDVVREVRVTYDANGETIVPGVGTPGVSSPATVDRLIGALRRTNVRAQRLEARQ